MDVFSPIFRAIGRIVGFMDTVAISIGSYSISLLQIEIGFLVLAIILSFIFPHGGDDE